MIRSHHHAPTEETIRVVFVYKNFGAVQGVSHIGLGVAAVNTVNVLRKAGLWAELWPVTSVADMRKKINEAQATATQQGKNEITHVIISAPWIEIRDLQVLCNENPEVCFASVCHSNLAFLQADPNAVAHLRDYLNASLSMHNFVVGGNTTKLTQWVERAWNRPCAFLPNLYDTDTFVANANERGYTGGTLRIGCFGATRVLKNLTTAAAAALQLAKQLRVGLEFWISRGRGGNENSTIKACQQIFEGEHDAVLKDNWWQSWPEFRRTVGHMHLCMQPSFTESFNMTTADAVAEGIPSVVSSAIDWAPRRWVADSDDAGDLVKAGVYLLNDRYAIEEGRKALKAYVSTGVEKYLEFLLTVR